ncbi:MAG: esterase family protein [Lachnospiraceae bacterium]|nr:esterase family protein [Lachnospiraceae bacterium]
MKKQILTLITATVLTTMLCSCGKSEEEKETMTDNEKVTETVTEIDKDAFASGIKTEDDNTTDADQAATATPAGADTAQSETGTDTGSQTGTSTGDLTDTQPGISTTPTEAPSPTPTPIIINDQIDEKCPASVTTTRKDVTYGAFTHGTYYSETCGMDRGYCILLPADYSTEKKYPVLYLLHGIFGNEYSFSQDASNKIKEIVGNMAADGYIEETIIVCPDMYAKTDPAQKPGFDGESCLPYDNFINDLVNDLMPYIEKEYSVLTGRENTYLAGFSMGGRETLFITLQKPELFGYVCAISAAPGIVATTDKFMTHPGMLEESEVKFAEDAVTPEVFILCCGSRDSVVGQYPKSYHEMLEANGSDHIWYEIPGADHDNDAIKSGLFNLFKQIAYSK